MNASVITFHRATSYGAVLQAYAIQRILGRYAVVSELVDFIPEDDFYRRRCATGLKNSAWNKNTLTRFIYRAIKAFDFHQNLKVFDSFVDRQLSVSKSKYRSLVDLAKLPPRADIYITGSDQVWNPDITQSCHDAFFWSFLPDDSVKIALSSSFGKTEFTESEMQHMCTYLSSYTLISVREQSAVSMLESAGLEDAVWIQDPTLLIPKKEWEAFAQEINTLSKDYVLLFQLNNDVSVLEYARTYAKRKELPLLKICTSVRAVYGGGKCVYCPSPEQWVALIRSASSIITDSFHGTAFCINLNKQFLTVLPPRRTTRLTSLLEVMGLTDRILTNADDYSVADHPIDYDQVNHILETERRKADAFLQKALNLQEVQNDESYSDLKQS